MGAFSRYEAFQDLCMEAAHGEREVPIQGITVRLQRGQVAGSLTWWATRWNWTVKQVRGWKMQLRQHAMIAISEGHTPPSEKGTRQDRLTDVITICNYERYQCAAPTKGRAKGTPPREKGQESNNRINKYSPLPLSGQGERVDAVRKLVAEQAAPSLSPEAVEALTAYNAAADRHGWVPKPQASLSPAEIRRLAKRVSEIGGPDQFKRAMAAVHGSRLDGDWTRRQRPDLTYVLSTGTGNGDLLRGLLDLAAWAEPDGGPWWADPDKRRLVDTSQWRDTIMQTVRPGFWDSANLSPQPDDPDCVIPAAVFDAATVAHCERCGFDVPTERRAMPRNVVVPFHRASGAELGRATA